MPTHPSQADNAVDLLVETLLSHAEEILLRRMKNGVTNPRVTPGFPTHRRRRIRPPKLSPRQTQILEILPADSDMSVAKLHHSLDLRVPLDTLKRSLGALVNVGLAERLGHGRGTTYRRTASDR